jgi:hypothetical protein
MMVHDGAKHHHFMSDRAILGRLVFAERSVCSFASLVVAFLFAPERIAFPFVLGDMSDLNVADVWNEVQADIGIDDGPPAHRYLARLGRLFHDVRVFRRYVSE